MQQCTSKKYECSISHVPSEIKFAHYNHLKRALYRITNKHGLVSLRANLLNRRSGEQDITSENEAGNRCNVNKQWKREQVFSNKASAQKSVEEEGIWSFYHKNVDTEGNVSAIYRCNKVKYRGEGNIWIWYCTFVTFIKRLIYLSNIYDFNMNAILYRAFIRFTKRPLLYLSRIYYFTMGVNFIPSIHYIYRASIIFIEYLLSLHACTFYTEHLLLLSSVYYFYRIVSFLSCIWIN